MPVGMFRPAESPEAVPEADHGGAWRFLWWLVRVRPGPLVLSAVLGALWMLPLALLPLVVGYAIDDGIRDGSTGSLLGWVGVVGVLAVVQAAAGAGLIQAAMGGQMHAVSFGHRVLVRQAARLGASLRHRSGSGDVVAVAAGDVPNIGHAFEVVGRSSGAVASFLVIAVALTLTSPVLGVVVLIGVPAALLGIGPLLRPLQRRNEEQRDRLGTATAQAGDICSGLRVLRGIGGERKFTDRFVDISQQVRRAGESAGRLEAWIGAAGVFLPGLVTIGVAWLGARLVLSGDITPGELVAFYGASVFLVIPVSTATEAVEAISLAHVAAGRICRFLSLTPEPVPPAEPLPLPDGPLPLADQGSGIHAPAGCLTTVVASGEHASRTAARLTHYGPFDDREGRPRVGDVPLDRADLTELRRRLVLSGHSDILFSGPLRAELAGERDRGDAALLDALHAAAATDVLEALPQGLDGVLVEGGRSLSGGQRQRLVLARALLTDADVLVLDDPTSAVDASTEALIAQRVAAYRAERTTVVFSGSPLWANAADAVVRPAPGTDGDALLTPGAEQPAP
ncbi:ABC transporter transmembrane domain-containing protein [Streptomyces olivoreticuli]|uniref:ABC transporter transmembrane domain-containing protein n=1 Tax=Streptomyces olivoreticuli TaxID=68246 RepID=UPI00196722D2|nr:ABC transporter ATP-binding protein [Streptomyces olivoreticuli]